MENRDILAPLDIELQKVNVFGGSMSVVVIPETYAEKALCYKREMDTFVRFKDYLIIGLFGVEADEASAMFLSIPKGIAVFPQDGADIQSLFFEAVERLRLKGKTPWVKRLWENIKDSKAQEKKEDAESRFINSAFYQYYAFLSSHPLEIGKILAELPEIDQHWIKDLFPYGIVSSMRSSGQSKVEDVTFIEGWQYQESMEEKKEKGKKTLRRFRNIEHLFTLPSISREIIDLASDSLLAASKMARIIEKDPVLTSRLLKVVNSAFYGFHRQINSVEHAIVILGNDEVVNIAFSIAIHKIMENISPQHAQTLWEHSLIVAHMSLYIGPILGCKAKDMIYTLGLLHDLGKIVFLQRGYNIVGINRPSTIEDLAAEERDTGLSHSEMGAYVAERWNLSEEIVEGLLCHHLPSKAKDFEAALSVHLADIIAYKGCVDIELVNNAAARFLAERKEDLLPKEKIAKVYQDIMVKVKLLLGV